MINKDLQNWATRVIEEVGSKAKIAERDFYPLQSPIKLQPEILFLGLNPGGGTSYESQCENLAWGPKGVPMSVEQLLLGNPDYEKKGDSWAIIKGLKKIPSFEKVLASSDYVFANYFYLSTPDFKDVSTKYKEALALCEKLTYELIELIQPKQIIILGTFSGIDRLAITDRKVELHGYKQRLLISGKLNDIPVYAIPHPSTLAITYEEIDAIDNNYKEITSGKPLSTYSFVPIDWCNFKIEEINQILTVRGIEATFVLKDKNIFTLALGVREDNLLVTIDAKGLYWHLRDANSPNKGLDRFYAQLKNLDYYTKSITNIQDEKSNSFVFKKSFKNYEAKSLVEIYNAFAEDILKLKN